MLMFTLLSKGLVISVVFETHYLTLHGAVAPHSAWFYYMYDAF